MRRRVGQGNLVEGLIGPTVGRNVTLDRIATMLDWPALEALLADLYASPTGRPSYPISLLLRALLLQAWYGLSDPAAEAALSDRLSFRRFLGVGLDEPTPDHSTLWRFREALAKRGLAHELLAAVNAQLDRHGVILRTGTLIDATLIEANVSARNERRDGRPVDPDARWTRRGKRSVLGYKMHVAVDQGSGLVRAAVVTDAATHDVRPGPGLVQGDEAMVTADKAYDSRAMRAAVDQAGAQDWVMHSARGRRRLKPWQTWMNRAVSPVRGAVERVFGTLKRSYRTRRARLWTGERNRVDLTMQVVAYNLRRAVVLMAKPAAL